ncbi:MAG: AbrB/MazE/SpoVT family DNA-binding domain-containing protein [Desulfuromonadales bacterium]
MRENAVVSSRGQITLPAGIRKRLGIKPGGVVILEDRDGELVVKPAVVVAVESYSDLQIAEWDADDRLADKDREVIRRRLSHRS